MFDTQRTHEEVGLWADKLMALSHVLLYVLRMTCHVSGIIFIRFLVLCCEQIHAEGASEPILIEEITVTPGKFTIHEGTDAKLSMSKKEIGLFPLIDNDVARAAQIFPGVVSSDFSARFNLRGGEKDKILVGWDGAI